MRVVTPFARPNPRRLGCAVVAAAALTGSGCGDGVPDGGERELRADDSQAVPRDGINVDGTNYPLVAAIGEIWGLGGDWPTHFNVDFTLTDGHFSVTPIVADGESASVREPVRASAVLSAELYAPEATAFRFAEYTFLAEPEASGTAIDGRHFFVGGRLGTDVDGSGEIESGEVRDIIGGSIDFEGPVPDIALTFDLVLEDGAQASGSYRGLFEFTTLEASR